ncbi:MAG: DUF3089 domain-containing protein [Bacteroidales bacterium]|nr:DUF3089 domain-containing protein [Bacteroidales bacterium]
MKNKRHLGIAISFVSVLCLTIASGCKERKVEFIPSAPDYENDLMWHIVEGDVDGSGADVFYLVSTWERDWKNSDSIVCHYADVWNEKHRSNMDIEITKVAAYMADGNNFYAPFYRHTTIEAFFEGEDVVERRKEIPIADVLAAFDEFNSRRDIRRPFIIAGFSQGGLLTVELQKNLDEKLARQMVAAYVLGYKVTAQDTLECPRIKAAQRSDDIGVTICYNTVKAVEFVLPMVSEGNTMCINPVNWATDSIPARLSDTVLVTASPTYKVLVTNYPATEYKPFAGVLNVGNIHSGEPWLYQEHLRKNFHERTKSWREQAAAMEEEDGR